MCACASSAYLFEHVSESQTTCLHCLVTSLALFITCIGLNDERYGISVFLIMFCYSFFFLFCSFISFPCFYLFFLPFLSSFYFLLYICVTYAYAELNMLGFGQVLLSRYGTMFKVLYLLLASLSSININTVSFHNSMVYLLKVHKNGEIII